MKRKGALRAGVLYCSRAGKIFASLSEGDLQEVRSTLAGFAEKREVAFSRENDGRMLQGKMHRCHQKGSFPQTPVFYVLSFLKRKYERKQFGRSFQNLPVVQGGAFLPRQLHQSKGGSAVRILKCF